MKLRIMQKDLAIATQTRFRDVQHAVADADAYSPPPHPSLLTATAFPPRLTSVNSASP